MGRKTTTERGYGWRQHGKHRLWWKQYLTKFGPIVCGCKGCPICGRPPCGRLVYAEAAMNPDRRPFHLGHGVALKHGGDGRDSVPWIGLLSGFMETVPPGTWGSAQARRRWPRLGAVDRRMQPEGRGLSHKPCGSQQLALPFALMRPGCINRSRGLIS